MVQGDSPAFLSLATGKVIGVPTAGQPGNQPVLGGSAPTSSSVGKATPLVAGTRNSGSTGVERAQAAGRNRPADSGGATTDHPDTHPDRRSGQDVR